MLRISVVLVVALVVIPWSVKGQIIKNDLQSQGFDNIHSEQVYVHYNATLLLSGERLYYKIYCLNEKTKAFSSLSKLAYIELIGSDNQNIFKHKVKLVSGMGQGDFVLPTTVPTGNYKLLAYTKWMGNSKSYFEGDLTVVNPYQKNTRRSVLGTIDSTETMQKNEKQPNAFQIGQDAAKVEQDSNLRLLTNKRRFAKREKIILTLEDHQALEGNGNYSISVRKEDGMPQPSMITSKMFAKQGNSKGNSRLIRDSIFLPELRGELIQGTVLSKSTQLPVSDQLVSLSLPGKDYLIKISKTNESGIFYFNIDRNYGGAAKIQLLGENHKLIIKDDQVLNRRELKFRELRLDSKYASLISERSIHNQIEQAYGEVKSDSANHVETTNPFYRTFDQTYNLDDYTRFSTVQEVFLEVIGNARMVKNRNGAYEFRVKNRNPSHSNKTRPMIIVDGLLVQDHGAIIDLDARKIKKIGLGTNEYKIGPVTYNGIISFETIQGDFPTSYKKDGIHTLELQRSVAQKEYFNPGYDSKSKMDPKRIPDLRHQLLWQPNIDFKGNRMTVECFTSDIPGTYQINLEGFSVNGNPVSIQEAILVE